MRLLMISLSLSEEIGASEAEAEALCRRLRAALAALPLHRDRFAVELLCREALANAIEHGCRFDPAKRISIALGMVGDTVVCRVHDEGVGFDFAVLPVDEPDELRERRNGIRIMKLYSDRCYFEDEGRTLVFERLIDEGSRT
jgi:anti-sigma regulatory factor (Ser/Thr protein kinase)